MAENKKVLHQIEKDRIELFMFNDIGIRVNKKHNPTKQNIKWKFENCPCCGKLRITESNRGSNKLKRKE